MATNQPTVTVQPSPRQLATLRLIAAGHSRAQAADALGVSPHTVQFHVRRLLHRTRSRTLIEAACKLGLFAIPGDLNLPRPTAE
jgi:DNA-binding CsgD family transcriptional regulator